jgi:hypothetical protein
MLCSDFPYASPWILLNKNFEKTWEGKNSVNFTLYEYVVVFVIYSVLYTFFFYHVVHILLYPVLLWFYFRQLVILDFLMLSSIYVRYQTNSLCIYRNPGSVMLFRCSVSDLCVIAHSLVMAAHWLFQTIQPEVCVNTIIHSTPGSPNGLSCSTLPPKILSLFLKFSRAWHEEEMHFNFCHSFGNACYRINTIVPAATQTLQPEVVR